MAHFPCIVPGCQHDAPNNFSVRLRKPPQADAVWAQNTSAYLCDQHASQGMVVTVTLELQDAQEVETHVSIVPGGDDHARTTPINPEKLP